MGYYQLSHGCQGDKEKYLTRENLYHLRHTCITRDVVKGKTVTIQYSEAPLVRRTIGPTHHWSDDPLVRSPIGPKQEMKIIKLLHDK